MHRTGGGPTETLCEIPGSPWFLVAWAALMLPSLAILIVDLRRNNAHLMSLMKLVWGLTGPIPGRWGSRSTG